MLVVHLYGVPRKHSVFYEGGGEATYFLLSALRAEEEGWGKCGEEGARRRQGRKLQNKAKTKRVENRNMVRVPSVW